MRKAEEPKMKEMVGALLRYVISPEWLKTGKRDKGEEELWREDAQHGALIRDTLGKNANKSSKFTSSSVKKGYRVVE